MSFEGKRGLVLGVANKRSIAWAIAQRLAEGGAQLAFTFQGERIESSVRDLAATVSSPLVTSCCDVRSDEDIARVFDEVGQAFDGELDFLVHSVAFAAAEDLEGSFVKTPREGFQLALDVSAYSLRNITNRMLPLMETNGGGVITLSYLAANRAMPNYNVMGSRQGRRSSRRRRHLAYELGAKNIRVNALSAGPVNTLAARSIAGFPTMEAIVEERARFTATSMPPTSQAPPPISSATMPGTSPVPRCMSTAGTTRWACRQRSSPPRTPGSDPFDRDALGVRRERREVTDVAAENSPAGLGGADDDRIDRRASPGAVAEHCGTSSLRCGEAILENTGGEEPVGHRVAVEPSRQRLDEHGGRDERRPEALLAQRRDHRGRPGRPM